MSGVLAASGAGVILQAVGSAAISLSTNVASQVHEIKTGKKKEFDTKELIIDTAIGFAVGLAGGKGASYGNSKGITQSGWQYLKRGILDKKAWTYYAKTAHAQGGTFVLTGLIRPTLTNVMGETIKLLKTRWLKPLL